MTKEHKLKVNMFTIILGATLIYLLTIIVIQGIKYYNSNIEVIDFSKDWNCSVDGIKLDKKHNLDDRFDDLKSNSEIVFSRKLPKVNSMVYPTLCLEYMWCGIEVYYDGKSIYKKDYVPSISSEVEDEINISDYKVGREVTIKLHPSNIERANFIKGAHILEGHEVIGYRIRQSLNSYVLGGLIAIFGLIVCTIAFFVNDRTVEIKKLFWIGCTFSLLASFIVSKKYLWIYLFEGRLATEIIMYLSIILVIPCVYKMHIYIFKDAKLRNRFRIGCGLAIVLAGILLLSKNNLSKYVNVNFVVIHVFGALYILTIILLILDFKNTEGIDRFFDIGMFIVYGIIISIVASFIICNYSVYIEVFNNGVLMIGAIMLVFSLVYCSYKIKEYMDNITESRVLTTLAYTDPLTGIMNRTKYEEVVEELKDNSDKLCTVVSFDLNNLKKINDENGHEAGDEYIKSFSKVLRIGFGEEGFIARIGGDEFIAIIKDKYVNVEGNIEMMQSLLGMTMKKYHSFEISFAYGIASRGRNDKVSILDLIEKSDKEMYKCKKKQKGVQENK